MFWVDEKLKYFSFLNRQKISVSGQTKCFVLFAGLFFFFHFFICLFVIKFR